MKKTLATTIQTANAILIAGGNLNAVGEFFAADYVAHITDEDVALDHAGIQKFLDLYWQAFPDLQVEVEILVEGKDRVAWQRTLRGTHEGAFKGFPPSGRLIVWRDMVTSRFHEGMIAEEWVISDLAERLLLSRKK